MHNLLEEQTEPDYPEQITKIILKTLGVADAKAIVFRFLESLQDASISWASSSVPTPSAISSRELNQSLYTIVVQRAY